MTRGASASCWGGGDGQKRDAQSMKRRRQKRARKLEAGQAGARRGIRGLRERKRLIPNPTSLDMFSCNLSRQVFCPHSWAAVIWGVMDRGAYGSGKRLEE